MWIAIRVARPERLFVWHAQTIIRVAHSERSGGRGN